jgi:hypothetical protein
MWIKRVEIAGWKSFSHDAPVVLDDCGSVNLLIGPNNSGKSNIARYFLRLADGANLNALRIGGYPWDEPPPCEMKLQDTDIFWGSTNQKVLATIEYWKNDSVPPEPISGIGEGGRFVLELTSDISKGQPWSFMMPLYVPTRAPLFSSDSSKRQYKLIGNDGTEVSDKSWKDVGAEIRSFLNLAVRSAIFDSIRIVGSQRNSRQSSHDEKSHVKLAPGDISQQLYELKNNQPIRWSRIQDDLQRWLGRVLGYPYPDLDFLAPGKLVTTLRRRPIEGDVHPPTSLEDLGTGVAEYFTLLAFLRLRTTDEPLAVFIDEIEAHLHPSATRELVRIIRKEFPHVQLFLATHSTDLIDQIEDDWRIFRFSMPDTHSIVTPISPKTSAAIETIWDLGYRPAQLFMANSIIFVEGPSDGFYLKALLEHLAPQLVEGRDYSLLFYGGANIAHISYEQNDKQLISLLNCANNPIVVSDRDRKDGMRLKPAVERMKSEADRLGRLFRLTSGYEIESIMTPEVLSNIANQIMKGLHKKHRGTVDPTKLDTTLSLRDALRGAIAPATPNTSANSIADRLAGKRKVDIARAFAQVARTNPAASFSKEGIKFGRKICKQIIRASKA